MSNLINLGCDVSDVHRRYAEIHGALFGITSYRMVIYALKGESRSMYSDYEHRLKGLEEELAEHIGSIKNTDLPLRNSADLHDSLIEYTRILSQVISGLKSICSQLKDEEDDYRSSADNGQSRFLQDKVKYDYSIRELERIGTKLNKLFSTY
ncbi:MAG: hypothetical protein KZQ92_08740 [Candidatus Thiodiazotropha sp. (ex Lucinoma borealis)]|nr:hypothetical protein [Candidatus Thiodiazotropha sp. (ex Lucinoma borealis)]MCU7864050.1 hypothetical protein [Candidatus Thiodiazotropha sp. (ex Lucinoma borealis)]MCU7867070.1 hypothetical protein [Candidatus Thiodiazotropha sp. (ex Lucinoma borealis)]MCU7948160.1 hypothetical protein [Candidatus Thiodiazotropha sp. (ex Cardiolucina cf. quadrata)]